MLSYLDRAVWPLGQAFCLCGTGLACPVDLAVQVVEVRFVLLAESRRGLEPSAYIASAKPMAAIIQRIGREAATHNAERSSCSTAAR